MGKKRMTDKEKELSLRKKYGRGLFIDLNKINTNPFFNLTTLSKKYGFSREYARQIYNLKFKRPFQPTRIKKTKKIKDEIKLLSCKNDPRMKYAEYKKGDSGPWKSTLSELLFFKECNNRGFKVETFCDNFIDIIINGYFVDVKSSYKLLKTSPRQKTPYHRFAISEKQKENCDYLACYHGVSEAFFIIPKNKFPKGRVIYITSKPISRYSNYWEYKNAWHLLSIKKESVCPNCGQTIKERHATK